MQNILTNLVISEILTFAGNERSPVNNQTYNPKNNKTEIKTNILLNVFILIVVIRIICWICDIEFKDVTTYIADVGFLSVPSMWILRSDDIFKYTKRKIKTCCMNFVLPFSILKIRHKF